MSLHTLTLWGVGETVPWSGKVCRLRFLNCGVGFLFLFFFINKLMLLHQVGEVSYITAFTFCHPSLLPCCKNVSWLLGMSNWTGLFPWSPQRCENLRCDSVFSKYLFANSEVGKIKTGCGGHPAGKLLTTFKSALVICLGMSTRDGGECPVWGLEPVSIFSLLGVPKLFSQDILMPF